jgi:hypothetical protein
MLQIQFSEKRIYLYTKIFKNQEQDIIFPNFFLLIFVSPKNEDVISVNNFKLNKV